MFRLFISFTIIPPGSSRSATYPTKREKVEITFKHTLRFGDIWISFGRVISTNLCLSKSASPYSSLFWTTKIIHNCHNQLPCNSGNSTSDTGNRVNRGKRPVTLLFFLVRLGGGIRRHGEKTHIGFKQKNACCRTISGREYKQYSSNFVWNLKLQRKCIWSKSIKPYDLHSLVGAQPLLLICSSFSRVKWSSSFKMISSPLPFSYL